MRLKIISLLVLVLSLDKVTYSQDIPLFSQKLSHSFLYNPAMAGHTFGSLTLSNRNNFADVEGTAESTFLSAHTPFYNYKFGAGLNAFREKVNFIDQIYISASFAYHILLGSYNSLSMGVSAEHTSIGFDTNSVLGDRNDQLLEERRGTYDFSFGLNYQHRYYKLGGAINRLSSRFSQTSEALSEFYSLYAIGLIPMRAGEDILEPSISYRSFSANKEILEYGLFYTYDNLVTAGLDYRQGDVLSLTIGLKVAKRIFFGYSYEAITTGPGDQFGPSNELTLRYDFSDKTYKQRFRQDYKDGLAYRRKTLRSTALKGRISSKSPTSHRKKLKRKIRKQKSPNERYNQVGWLKKKKFRRKKRRYKLGRKRRHHFRKRY